MPFYAFYALLFSNSGLSGARISSLFIIWSVVGFLAEVPSGALADRLSRRFCLVTSGLLQCAGFALWITIPGYSAFAAGFVLWGVGGAFASGAFEAVVYEGLSRDGAQHLYPRINALVNSLMLLAQVPSALAAAFLYRVGGYDAVGWVSIFICLLSCWLATRLPEAGRAGTTSQPAAGYLTVMRRGMQEAATQPGVRYLVVAAAVVGGLDALEEYFPLMAQDWGVRTEAVPLAVLGVFLAGAAGAALGGRADRLRARILAALLVGALLVLAAGAIAAVPAGLLAVAMFYAIHQMVLVVTDARLQQRIQGDARATVTSVASLATEVMGIVVFLAWAWNGLLLVAAIWLVLSPPLARWLRPRALR